MATEHISPNTEKELKCLADNIYYESASEPFKGKLAVAIVTLNRVKSPDYPNTICKVVYQKNQFSWTKHKLKVKNMYVWTDALLAATMAMENSKLLGNFKATHYHNLTVQPKWANKLTRVVQIKNHIFYQS